jgi:hypothetical protein
MKSITTIATLILLCSVVCAQTSTTAAEEAQMVKELKASQDEFVRLSNEYKKSLAELLTFYEKDVKRAEEKQTKLQELYAQGLIGQRDLDAGAQGIADAKAKVAEAQKQLDNADKTISEVLAESADTIAHKLAQQKRRRERTPQGRIYYVRFVIYGQVAIYDYSGAVHGKVIKHHGRVKYDSRK